MVDNILSRLMEKSGGAKTNFPSIPTVKLDGSGTGETAGSFLRFADGDMTNLGTTLSIRIIKIRKKLALGTDTEKYFSRVYDNGKTDKLTLWKQKYGEKEKTLVMEGTPEEIRSAHPVKVVSVVYGIVNDSLVQFAVKGASCTGDDGLYTYLDGVRDAGLGIFQVETEVTVSKIAKNRAISYHRAHFKQGKTFTDGFEAVEEYLDLINGTPSDKKVADTSDAEVEKVFNDSF